MVRFELGRSSDKPRKDLLNIVNKTAVPRKLLSCVGNDYFQSNINVIRQNFQHFTLMQEK